MKRARKSAKFFQKYAFLSVFSALRGVLLFFVSKKQREVPESASLFHNFVSHIRSNGYFSRSVMTLSILLQSYDFFSRYARVRTVFLNLPVWISPGERKKKKKRTKRIRKKKARPVHHLYYKGGSPHPHAYAYAGRDTAGAA